MKRLRSDEAGLIPLLIGAGVVVAALFGGSYLLTGEDPVTALLTFLKWTVIVSLVFLFGILVLMNKLPVIPAPYNFLIGIGAIAGSIYMAWRFLV